MRTRFAECVALLWIALGLAAGCGQPERGESAAAQPPAVGVDWLAKAQRQLAQREYRASRNGEGLQAPNRAHNLRTYFGTTGIQVHDRTVGGSPELLRLSLAGVGREGALSAALPGEVRSEGARVEIRRPGLIEWYENSESGLEQGFTLQERPPGEGPLVVELALTGARASRRGDELVFETAAQRKLGYGKLAASGADGAALPAHFEVASAERVRIVVGDSIASYPLVIDPLLTGSADARLESNQISAELGISAAAAGDVNGDGYGDVIVGGWLYDAGQIDEGAAFVFLGSASGIADADPTTAATQIESNQISAGLVSSVAGAGDVNGDGYADVIVGAGGYDAGEDTEGAAFVFLGSASGIAYADPTTAATRIQANQTAAELGSSVAGAVDVNGDGYADVIVGAGLYDSGQTNEGAAFVF